MVGTPWELTAAGRNAGVVVEGAVELDEVVAIFIFTLPSVSVVWAPYELGTAGIEAYCGGRDGVFWMVDVAGRVGVGRFVATPLDTSRTRPSSKVVIGVPLLK